MRESVVIVLVVFGVVVVPFFLLQCAKLISYGWASGRRRFERDHKGE